MSRNEFIDSFKHEIAGMVLDGAVAERRGAELGMFARDIMIRTSALLARAYDQLHPPTPAVGTGANKAGNPPPRK